jgi:ATP-dependent helicase/DNAse subunit B
LEDGAQVKINGVIDRIDRVGDALVVIDYKTGSGKFRREDMQQGRSFQMVTYLLAAEHLMQADPSPNPPREVAGGLFWHIRSAEISGTLKVSEHHAVTEEALGHLNRYITLMRQGDFAEQPGKAQDGKCTLYCEYQHLCRLCALGLAKS